MRRIEFGGKRTIVEGVSMDLPMHDCHDRAEVT